MSRLKVLFLTYPFFSLEKGGFQIQVLSIKEELLKLGVEVVLFNPWSQNLKDIDVVHVFSLEGSSLPFLQKSKDLNIPIICTPMIGSRYYSNLFLSIGLLLSKCPELFTTLKLASKIVKFSDLICPLSHFEKNRINKVFGINSSRIEIIPNGINSIYTSNVDFSHITLPYDDYIVIVGRIEPNKNQLNMIKVANQLGLNLIIVGGVGVGSKKYYEKCVSLSGENVTFWGEEEDLLILKKIISNAIFLVQPSFSEMVPLTVFESLAVKTPVICTKNCSLYGFSQNLPNLYFSSPKFSSLLKNVKHHLINSKEFIFCDYKNYLLTWKDVAEKYLQMYNKLKNNKYNK